MAATLNRQVELDLGSSLRGEAQRVEAERRGEVSWDEEVVPTLRKSESIPCLESYGCTAVGEGDAGRVGGGEEEGGGGGGAGGDGHGRRACSGSLEGPSDFNSSLEVVLEGQTSSEKDAGARTPSRRAGRLWKAYAFDGSSP